MLKLVAFHDEQGMILAFMNKFTKHIHNPAPCLMIPTVKEKISTTEVVEAAKQYSGIRTGLFLINHTTTDVSDLYQHFNIFNVWDDPVVFSKNKHLNGVWIDNPHEIDYLFNQILPFVFD